MSKFISERKKKKFCVFLYIWVFHFSELIFVGKSVQLCLFIFVNFKECFQSLSVTLGF